MTGEANSVKYNRGWNAAIEAMRPQNVAYREGFKNAAKRVGHQRHELKMLNRLLAWERQENKAEYDRLHDLAEGLAEANWKLVTDRREAQTKIDKLRTLMSDAPRTRFDVCVAVQAILDGTDA